MAAAAAEWAAPGERIAAVIPTESDPGHLLFLVAFEGDAGEAAAGADPARAWLALDRDGAVVVSWPVVRDAVSIAVMCEVAEEMAGGGDLDDLRARLIGVRLVENPPGIDEAIAALDELERTLGRPPRVASPGYLDAVGAAVRGLERALGESGSSPFTEAMKQAPAAITALAGEIERGLRTQRP